MVLCQRRHLGLYPLQVLYRYVSITQGYLILLRHGVSLPMFNSRCFSTRIRTERPYLLFPLTTSRSMSLRLWTPSHLSCYIATGNRIVTGCAFATQLSYSSTRLSTRHWPPTQHATGFHSLPLALCTQGYPQVSHLKARGSNPLSYSQP